MNKICFKCNIEKSTSSFYKHKGMKDGYLGKCKDCTKKDTRIREISFLSDKNWKEKEKERHREKYYRLGYKDKHKPTKENKKAIIERYNKKYPEKKIVKNLNSINKPLIKGNELHHWSYNIEHAKDTIELTIAKHAYIHRFLTYDQLTKMYFILNTNILLDTKEKHLKYINSF